MTGAFRFWALRFAASACAAVVAMSGLTTPAAAGQTKSSIPVWTIESIGSVVASRDRLTHSGMVLDIGYEGQQQITFRFELDGFAGNPMRFLGGYADSACHTEGPAPATVVECSYSREIVVGQRERFSFQHKISRPGASTLPLLWITASVSGGSLRQGVQIKGVAPEADLVVTVDGPGAGRVGDIVQFTWTVTNAGLDPVYDRAGVITFTAPPGTEFADTLANTAPDDMICQVTGSVQVRRPCWFAVISPGQVRKEKWRLRILSSTVGEGRVEALLSHFTGQHPQGDYQDPTPGNNAAAIRVSLLAGGTAPGGLPMPATSAGPSASPPASSDPLLASTSPSAIDPAESGLPASSSSAAPRTAVWWWTAAVVLVLLAALTVSAVLRRRRVASNMEQ